MTGPVLDPNYDPRSDGAMREGGHKLVKPRHAATLIIVRRDAKKPRLLMGRRNRGHAFMPDKWVFPGGRINRGDFTAPSATELSPEVETRLAMTARHASPRLPRALALAAIRETFEEAGLLLARSAPQRPGAGPPFGGVVGELGRHLRRQVGGVGRAEIRTVDAPAREHPLVGHEVVALGPPAHQQPRLGGVAAYDNQGGGVAGTHGLLTRLAGRAATIAAAAQRVLGFVLTL